MSNKITTEITQVINNTPINKTKIEEIKNMLTSFFDNFEEWEQLYDNIIINSPLDVDKMKIAGESRLIIKRRRLEADNILKAKRNEVKLRMADDMLEDKLLLKLSQIIESYSKELESKFEDKEKFAERYEQQQRELLHKERELITQQYQEFIPVNLDFGNMSEDEFNKLLTGAKLQLEAKIKAEKEEIERKEELQRIDKLHMDRLRLVQPYWQFVQDNTLNYGTMSDVAFNDIIQSLKYEKGLYDKDQLEKEEANKKLQQQLKEQEDRLHKEQLEKELAENKLKEIKEKEKEKELELIKEQEKLSNSSDKDKLLKCANDILNVNVPIVNSEYAMKITSNIKLLINKLHKYIIDETNKL